MFDLKVTQRVAMISENTRNGKSLQLNRVSVNGRPEDWDLAKWQYDDETGMPVRKGGVIMSDAEFENLKKILETN